MEEGPEVAAQIIGSEPLELADKATVSALIEDLKARKEAAAKKVTRSSGPDDWHYRRPPVNKDDAPLMLALQVIGRSNHSCGTCTAACTKRSRT